MKVPISIEYELPQRIASGAKTRVTGEIAIPDGGGEDSRPQKMC
jgi:hypothetical protein